MRQFLNWKPARYLVALAWLPAMLLATENGAGYWDGRLWRLQPFPSSYPGRMLVDHLGRLIVAGTKLTVLQPVFSDIAVWDGQSWSTLGGGVANGFPYSVAVSDDGLVAVVGHFAGATGVAATNAAVWRHDHWMPLGLGFIYAQAAPQTGLWRGHDRYVTGSAFTTVNGLESPSFATNALGNPGQRFRDGFDPGDDSLRFYRARALP